MSTFPEVVARKEFKSEVQDLMVKGCEIFRDSVFYAAPCKYGMACSADPEHIEVLISTAVARPDAMVFVKFSLLVQAYGTVTIRQPTAMLVSYEFGV